MGGPSQLVIERYRPKLGRVRVEVYYAYNRVTGKCYVGQTTKRYMARIKGHVVSKGNNPFQRALRKYGLDSFVIGLIDVASTLQFANDAEKFWISRLACKTPTGYNVLGGGRGYTQTSNAGKNAIVESNRRRLAVPGTQELMQRRRREVGVSEYHRQTASALCKQRNSDPEFKRKVSAALKHHPASEVTRAKIAASLRRYQAMKRAEGLL